MMIIPISDVILLPGNTYGLILNKFTEAEKKSLENEAYTFLQPMKEVKSRAELQAEDLYPIGAWVQVESYEEVPQGCKVTLKVLKRVKLSDLSVGADLITGNWSELDEIVDLSEDNRTQMLGTIQNMIGEIAAHFPQGKALMQYMEDIRDLNELMVFQSQFMVLSNEERYSLMETSSLKERCMRFLELLMQNKASAVFQLEMNEKLNEENQKKYREAVLRRQLQAIQEELGESDGAEAGGGESDWKQRIREAHMPEAVEKEALKQLERLEHQGPNGHETDSLTNYLELITSLAWEAPPVGEINITEARRILEEQHYGLQKVKDRILQHLSVMRLREGNMGSILLLVGPPGTGKTSLGKSIAQALNRNYIRISLGGVRDEAEIRGHRRTYVGAMPGRIIQEIKKSGVMDPVIVLDEVDKLSPGGYNGDPAGALLEVLDPEQNNNFTDHYLNVPYDLSHVFFLCTANSLDTIPQPLLDRMEVIQVTGYTSPEKLQISRRHLVPKSLEEHGLNGEQLRFTDEALQKLIADYTMESGVRGLKKKINTVCRAVAAQVVEANPELPRVVDADDLEELLDQRAMNHDAAADYNPPGVVTGLAWTAAGGEILFVECTGIPGSGQIILTGQLGDVMKESATISVSLLKSRLPINTINLKEKDIHVHVPSGAVPKDGPSAGITLFTALVSMVTGIPVDPKLAMTGEITLRGSVLPIGGLKEKLMAADRAGIQRVLIPAKNVPDLKDVPESVKEKLQIVPIETVDELLQEVFGSIVTMMGDDFRFLGLFPVQKGLYPSTVG